LKNAAAQWRILTNFEAKHVWKSEVGTVVVRNSPENPSTKKSMVPLVVSNGTNTYPNIDTYPLNYRPVDLSRSILTVDDDSPTKEYVRYRRSIRFRVKRISLTSTYIHTYKRAHAHTLILHSTLALTPTFTLTVTYSHSRTIQSRSHVHQSVTKSAANCSDT